MSKANLDGLARRRRPLMQVVLLAALAIGCGVDASIVGGPFGADAGEMQDPSDAREHPTSDTESSDELPDTEDGAVPGDLGAGDDSSTVADSQISLSDAGLDDALLIEDAGTEMDAFTADIGSGMEPDASGTETGVLEASVLEASTADVGIALPDLPCPAGQILCAGTCRSVTSDRANCGACGLACSARSVCTGGSCVACPGAQAPCGSGCADLTSDSANCGACGVVCGVGRSCDASTCIAGNARPPGDTRASAATIPWIVSTVFSPAGLSREALFRIDTSGARNDTTGPCTCTSGNDVFYRITDAGLFYAEMLDATWHGSLFIQDASGVNITSSRPGTSTCNDRLLPGCTGAGAQIAAFVPAGAYLVVSGCESGLATIHTQISRSGLDQAVSSSQFLDPTIPGAQQFHYNYYAGGAHYAWSYRCPDFPGGPMALDSCNGSIATGVGAADSSVSVLTGSFADQTQANYRECASVEWIPRGGGLLFVSNSYNGTFDIGVRRGACPPGQGYCGVECRTGPCPLVSCREPLVACGSVCSRAGGCPIGSGPVNDRREGARVVDLGESGITTVTAVYADTRFADNTTSGPCACSSGRDIFYRLRIGANQRLVHASTVGAPPGTTLFLQDSTGRNLASPRIADGSTCGSNGGAVGGCPAEPEAQVFALLPPGTYDLVVSGCSAGQFGIEIQHLSMASTSSVRLAPVNGTSQHFEGTTIPRSASEYLACGGGSAATSTWYHLACRNDPASAWTVALSGGNSGFANASNLLFQLASNGRIASRGNDAPFLVDTSRRQATVMIPAGSGVAALTIASCGASSAGATPPGTAAFSARPYILDVTYGDCPMGRILISGRCVDPDSDPEACGPSAYACRSGQVCRGGTCDCPAGKTLCGGRCVDLLSDAMNCGRCGGACASTESCTRASCAPAGLAAGGQPGTFLPIAFRSANAAQYVARYAFSSSAVPGVPVALPLVSSGGSLWAQVPLHYRADGNFYSGSVDVSIVERGSNRVVATARWDISPLIPRPTGAPGDVLLRRIESARRAINRIPHSNYTLAGRPARSSPGYVGLDGFEAVVRAAAVSPQPVGRLSRPAGDLVLSITPEDLRLYDAYLLNEDESAPPGVSVLWGCHQADETSEMMACVGKAAASVGAVILYAEGTPVIAAVGVVISIASVVVRAIETEAESGVYNGTPSSTISNDPSSGVYGSSPIRTALNSVRTAFIRSSLGLASDFARALCGGSCTADLCAGVSCDEMVGAYCSGSSATSVGGAHCDPSSGNCVADSVSSSACGLGNCYAGTCGVPGYTSCAPTRYDGCISGSPTQVRHFTISGGATPCTPVLTVEECPTLGAGGPICRGSTFSGVCADLCDGVTCPARGAPYCAGSIVGMYAIMTPVAGTCGAGGTCVYPAPLSMPCGAGRTCQMIAGAPWCI